MPNKIQRLMNWLFKDNSGRFVIFQIPNAYLLSWILAAAVSMVSTGLMQEATSAVATIAIIIWSYKEITAGANGLRRILGLVVLTGWFISRL